MAYLLGSVRGGTRVGCWIMNEDRIMHAVGALMVTLIAFGLWFGREAIVIILWAVFS